MSEPFIGEIRMAGFNFAPRGWALCDGQLLSISQNPALFSLLGTQYGGDGRTTFALPNLQSRLPMHQGQGPGLSNRTMGEFGGNETVTLLTSNIPPHNHLIEINNGRAAQSDPTNAFLANSGVDSYATTANNTMNPQATTVVGGGQPVDMISPFLVVNFIIALEGIFPSRN